MNSMDHSEEKKYKVLFIGYYDSARTQIASAFLHELYPDYFEVYTGGIEAKEISQYAIDVMKERGIDISAHTPKDVDLIIGKQVFDYVVILCDKASEYCPYFPGGKKYIHANIENPHELTGSEAEIIAGFRRIRNKTKKFIEKTFTEELKNKRKEYSRKKMLEVKRKPEKMLTYACEPAPIDRVLRPFKEFVRIESSGGIVIIFSIIAALVFANFLGAIYLDFWDIYITIGVGTFSISQSLHLWINDGLMVLFFFVIGLEIKREGLVGELNSLNKAILPIAAALGGMIFPVIIFMVLNLGSSTFVGWGIPMATDIAIALAIITLLGQRVPYSLKVFLTAFAIVDDIGAVIVIAVFYTSEISILGLAIGGIFLVTLLSLNRFGVVNPLPYIILGLGLWLGFLESGIHATIAGILLALTIPTKTRISDQDFLDLSRATLEEYERTCESGKSIIIDKDRSSAVKTLSYAASQAQPLLKRLELYILPWVTFLILPIFALSNGGVLFSIDPIATFTNPLTIGIMLGLIIGKPIGIFLFSWLVVRFKLTSLPKGINWKNIYGTAWLGGVGFTMSIFITTLAFEADLFLSTAKIGIILASFICGVVGYLILKRTFSQGPEIAT